MTSGLPIHHEIRQLPEKARLLAKFVQMGGSARSKLVRFSSGTVHSINGNKRGLTLLHVLTCSFTELFGCSGHIKKIVRDSEGETEVARVMTQAFLRPCPYFRENRACFTRVFKQSAGFEALQMDHIVRLKRAGGCLHIDHLPADHAVASG